MAVGTTLSVSADTVESAWSSESDNDAVTTVHQQATPDGQARWGGDGGRKSRVKHVLTRIAIGFPWAILLWLAVVSIPIGLTYRSVV